MITDETRARALVDAYFDGWNARGVATVARTFAASGTYQDPASGAVPGAEIARVVEPLRAAFPDLAFDRSRVVGAGGRLVVEWVMRGHNRGAIRAGIAPTERAVTLEGVDVFEVSADGIQAVRRYFDQNMHHVPCPHAGAACLLVAALVVDKLALPKLYPRKELDMKIAFVGAGKVGAPLAARLAEAGHEVALAEAREGSSSVAAALARSTRLVARPLSDAVGNAEVVFLATPFGAVENMLRPLASQLAGKVLVDCTNPVGPGLTHGLKSERSGSELIQSIVPEAHVVKAFSIYGFENFEDPSYPNYAIKPAMLFCGDNSDAKERASKLIADCGFEPFDVGGLVQALHLEHMTLLWVRMVRAFGHSPHFVWGALERTRPA